MNGKFPSYSPMTSTLSSSPDFSPTHGHGPRATPYQIKINDDPVELSVQSTTRSALTPLRKHHKLLKDGTGNEVWPESVEQIFVDGLRAYYASTISQNHIARTSDAAIPGRSRLRNAFLVQHLAQYGIERSRKQVASHLQVLKNMWRADGNFSNYRLVSGSDSSSEQHSNSQGSTERHPSPSLSYFSTSSSSSSSHRPSLGMASPESWSRLVTSPYSSPVLPTQSTQRRNLPKVDEMSEVVNRGISMSTAPNYPEQTPRTTIIHRQEPPNCTQQLEHCEPQLDSLIGSMQSTFTSIAGIEQALAEETTAFVSDHKAQNRQRHQLHKSVSVPLSSDYHSPATTIVTSEKPLAAPITPTKLYLFTDAMLPLIVNLDKLPGDGVAYLCLQLDVPKPQAISSLAKKSLSGFGVQLEATCPVTRSPFTNYKCITQVWGVSSDLNYSARTIGFPGTKQEPLAASPYMLRREVLVAQTPHKISEDQVPMSCLARQEAVVTLSEQALSRSSNRRLMMLYFPESALSSCQLLEQGAMMIHQELSFSGQTFLRMTYNLNRQEQLPAAKLLWWERLPTVHPVISPNSLNRSTPSQWLNEPHIQLHAECSEPHCSMEDTYSPPQSFVPYL
ncbi:uncharacterized protein C8R40DRAFT_538809 [Lentinula edodes]|uniref:uncharacterized protein n=1 Tax=Lentinula edodes TaxID=5353 RepID=UPI001E8EA074|nr:uncharacterized protein C8R40DRAFT_538809 [Lentinula edodes]KAH7871889.1 hypothetical protein C8R40DRAFT_538809 [Lentinula edodes]